MQQFALANIITGKKANFEAFVNRSDETEQQLPGPYGNYACRDFLQADSKRGCNRGLNGRWLHMREFLRQKKVRARAVTRSATAKQQCTKPTRQRHRFRAGLFRRDFAKTDTITPPITSITPVMTRRLLQK